VDDNLLPRKSSTLLLHNYFEFPDPSQECCEVGVVCGVHAGFAMAKEEEKEEEEAEPFCGRAHLH